MNDTILLVSNCNCPSGSEKQGSFARVRDLVGEGDGCGAAVAACGTEGEVPQYIWCSPPVLPDDPGLDAGDRAPGDPNLAPNLLR